MKGMKGDIRACRAHGALLRPNRRYACDFGLKRCKVVLDTCRALSDISPVIRTFRNKELAALWAGMRTRIDHRLHKRILQRLDALDAAGSAEEMNVPGFDFHPLKSFDPTRFTVHVNGPWCLTFEFSAGDALRVDFEQYH